MKKPRLITVLFFLTCVIPVTTFATKNTQREQVEILFKLTKMEKKITQSVNNIVQLELRQKPQLSQKRKALTDFINKYIGWNAMKEELTKMYMKMFTEQELKAINDFYITPAGQKIINETPKLVQYRNQLAMKRLQQNIGELQKIME